MTRFAATWDQFLTYLGLDESQIMQTLLLVFQVVLVLLLAAWAANWLSHRVRRLAQDRASADVTSLSTRAAALAIYGIGVAFVLSLLGLNPTAIAAILGAAAVGITLALQDVAKSVVDGVYILVERPFRIGDRIRVGSAEGKVEEIGVRLTRLRTDAGAHILVPSTQVFTGVIQNATAGTYHRRQYSLTGVTRPIVEIEAAAIQALKSTPHLSRRKPVVEIVSSGPDGTTSYVTVEHDARHRVDHLVISRLRTEFPETTVSVEPSPTS